jgi:hypothetical protein
VSNDTELEIWRQEWRDQTEPLPELRKKIKRQNLRTAAAIVAIGVCLAVSTSVALKTRSPFMAGLAAGIVFASVFMGGYAWWVRRGAWKPTAQTTLAYAELVHRRAIATRDGVIIAAMTVELFFMKHFGERKQREIEATRKLIDDLK